LICGPQKSAKISKFFAEIAEKSANQQTANLRMKTLPLTPPGDPLGDPWVTPFPPGPTTDLNTNKIQFLFENIWDLDFKPLQWGPGPVQKKFLPWFMSWGHKLSIEP
jgi:hypothetical protein